ncbi:MAG: hypothetical protein SPI30_05720 [Prevotella sp.]|nr:hypothetical protein [Prevotella sp.]
MKKLTIVAMMALTASSAFAQEDIVKQIMKTKDYAQAAELIKQHEANMSAEQNAKCYNKLVDLAMEKVNSEQMSIQTNEMAMQAGQKTTPIDTIGFYNALITAIDAGVACNKYDNMPNDKGKVKVKYYNANKDRLYPQRPYLINGGGFYQEKNDVKNAYRFLARYVDSADEPLFASFDKSKDENLTQIAYYAAIFAYQNKDRGNMDRYATIALNDPTFGKEAMNLKLAFAQENLKTKNDSLNYVKMLEETYARDKENEVVFETLAMMYSQMNMDAPMNSLFEEKLVKDPDNFTVWAIRGQNAMIAQKLEDAITFYKKALVKNPDNAQVLTWLGACLLDRATQAEERAAGRTGRVAPAAEAQIMPIFEEAREALEKAKSIDPAGAKSKWAYPLYRCYYRLYGANDQRTKDAQADANM